MPLPDLSRIPRRTILIIGIAAVVLVGGALVWFNLMPARTRPVALTMWGSEPEDVWRGVISAYQTQRKDAGHTITVDYRQFSEEGYRDAVTNALAAGAGPDIIMVGNRELEKDIAKLAPAPRETFALLRLRELFPTVVEQDYVRGTGDIYALPLYIDTLTLFYNRDLFDTVGIVSPPKTWQEFENHAVRLRKLSLGKFEREGAAIGGTNASVSRGVDILELLMIQNGAPIIDAEGRVRIVGTRQEGLEAFDFYLSFAQPNSSRYTWSNDDKAEDAFVAGRAAMMFGYASDARRVTERAPFLLFGIAPAPQPEGASVAVSTARYKGLAVAKQSRASGWAWDFIVFAATDGRSARTYSTASGNPPALRSLIAEYVKDATHGAFGAQALTARSWRIADDDGLTALLDGAIRDTLGGTLTSYRALRGVEDALSRQLR